jgi:hypothetical protein
MTTEMKKAVIFIFLGTLGFIGGATVLNAINGKLDTVMENNKSKITQKFEATKQPHQQSPETD